jgi:hypothetical protein
MIRTAFWRALRHAGLLPVTPYHLLDVPDHAAAWPYTFYCPSETLLSAVGENDQVQLHLIYTKKPWLRYSGERLWFRVVERLGDAFVGELLNQPCDMIGLEKGAHIPFGANHIANVVVRDGLKMDDGDGLDRYAGGCLVSRSIMEGAPVFRVARQNSVEKPGVTLPDTGWLVLAEDFSETELFSDGSLVTRSLGAVLNLDDRWHHLLDEPAGEQFQWCTAKGEFVRLEPFDPAVP